MCFYLQITKDAQTLAKRFRATYTETNNMPQGIISAFTFPSYPIITNINQDIMQLFSWGLIPEWSKDNNIRKYTLNARIETLTEKPAFRHSVHKRCLIPANGFIEWKWLDPKGIKKQKFLITTAEQHTFAIAGLWSKWIHKQTNEFVRTFTIVTTEANPFMAEIHNSKKRMPVILTPENELNWLEGAETEDFRECNLNLAAKGI